MFIENATWKILNNTLIIQNTTLTIQTTTLSIQNNTLTIQNITEWSITNGVVYTTILGTIIVLSICLNLLVCLALNYSIKLRRRSNYRLLTAAAFANLLDAAFNQSISFVASYLGSWYSFPLVICQWQTFGLIMVDHAIIFTMLIQSVDRVWAVSNLRSQRRRFRIVPVMLTMIVVWLCAFGFALPLVLANLKSYVVESGFNCAPGRHLPLSYVLSELLLGFFVPLVSLFILYVILLRIALKENQRRQNSDNSNGSYKKSNKTAEDAPSWSEINQAKLTATLVVLWLILFAPYMVMNMIERLKNSWELYETLNPHSNGLLPSWAEVLLMLLRYSNSLALPLTCFAWRRDLRCKLRLMCCKSQPPAQQRTRTSPVISLQRRAPALQTTHKSDNIPLENKGSCPAVNTVSSRDLNRVFESTDSTFDVSEKECASPHNTFKVPVLYATSQGLHIHGDLDDSFNSGHALTFEQRGFKCDVSASQSDIISVVEKEIENEKVDLPAGETVDENVAHLSDQEVRRKKGHRRERHRNKVEQLSSDRNDSVDAERVARRDRRKKRKRAAAAAAAAASATVCEQIDDAFHFNGTFVGSQIPLVPEVAVSVASSRQRKIRPHVDLSCEQNVANRDRLHPPRRLQPLSQFESPSQSFS